MARLHTSIIVIVEEDFQINNLTMKGSGLMSTSKKVFIGVGH